MLTSYKQYMGIETRQRVNKSGGVMIAATSAITMMAWRR